MLCALNVTSKFLFYLFTFIDESLCVRTELSENVVWIGTGALSNFLFFFKSRWIYSPPSTKLILSSWGSRFDPTGIVPESRLVRDFAVVGVVILIFTNSGKVQKKHRQITVIIELLLVEHELLTLPEHLGSPLLFSGVRVALVFCVVFCRSALLSFFCWPLCYISILNFQPLITPLVYSNSSYTLYVFIFGWP